MCGISGIFSNHPIENINYRARRMMNSMSHRGPDYSSFEIYNYDATVLIHNRLKIIDLSKEANMPMESNCGRYSIVFNGEIYNFQEIKSYLNYQFHTSSDTEVILAAMLQFGIDWFLQKANGMFAIALFDTQLNKLYLIRDRFGIKPLFYYIKNNILIFGSEIKAILESGLVDAKPNYDAFDFYFGFRYVPEPLTLFKDIYQLEVSTYNSFTFKNNNLTKQSKTYWQLPNCSNEIDFNKPEEYYIDLVDEKLNASVKRRLMSDVPLGAYLSGGLDSSLMTALILKNSNNTENINTYTVGFPEKGFSEFEYSRITSEHLKTKNHEITISNKESYLDEWEKLISYRDYPLGVPNEIPLAVMSRELKKKITVVISGEGADELFGGYGKIYRLPYYYKTSNINSSFEDLFLKTYEYVPREIRDQYLTHDLKSSRIMTSEIFNNIFNNNIETDIFQFFHKVHIKSLLYRLDATTMQASVEGRVPFLDHDLIETIYTQIPYSLKLKWKEDKYKNQFAGKLPDKYSEIYDYPKYILKKVSERYLPNEIIYRKKVGFPVPLNSWFDKDFLDLVYGTLKSSKWMDTEKIPQLIKMSKENARSGQILWMFLNVEMWYNKYFIKNWRYN